MDGQLIIHADHTLRYIDFVDVRISDYRLVRASIDFSVPSPERIITTSRVWKRSDSDAFRHDLLF